jgi:hypothetical protein
MSGPWEKYGAVEAGPWQQYSSPQQAETPSTEPSISDRVKGAAGAVADYYKNAPMGALRGAARIGTTLLRPVDAALNAAGITETTNKDRVRALDDFSKENADPNSLGFQSGDVFAQIAGTSGVGGLLAKGVNAVPALANAVPRLATALQSGGMALGGTPATTIAGKAGEMALRTGAGAVTGGAMTGLVNPEEAGTGAMIGGGLPIATKAAGAVGKGIRSAGEHILGAMTGTGSEAVKGAFKAGQVGSREFLENMRGQTSFDDVVTAAKQGLRTMRAERGAHYRSGMVDIKADKSVLDMSPITSAVDELRSAGNFKGKVINEKSSGVVKEISDKVEDWAKSSPEEFHTPEGLDALKQAIGDIRDSTQFGTQARRAADSVYNTIKSQIDKQAPTYSKVMKDYAEASKTISEIEKALSLGEKSSKDTAIRKLQSLMRNNAQTNYGNRLNLAKTLEEKGGVDLGPSLAGQAMNSWLPRGMVGSIEKAGMVGAPFVAPGALAVAPLTSPRLIGETMYGLGRLSGGAGNALGMNRAALSPGVNGILAEMMANPATRAGLLTLSGR